MTPAGLRPLVTTALAALVALAPGPAHADTGLELSRDGVRWGTSLDQPLFGDGIRLVPGGRTEATLWVRNSTGGVATVTVVVRGARSTMPRGVLAADDFTVRAGGGRSATGSELAGCRLLTTSVLGAGERRGIPVTVSLPETSRQVSEDRSLTLPVVVQLTAGRVARPTPCGDVGATPAPTTPAATPDATPVAPASPSVVQTDGGPFSPRALVPTSLGLLLLVLVAFARRGARVIRRGEPAPHR